MKIGFVDVADWDYHVETVDHSALGGSQSAACYLARALARMGHEVHYFSGTTLPGSYAGVDCRAWNQISVAEANSLRLDAVVCLLAAGVGARLREIFAPKVLVLWNQHAHDQPAVQPLKDPAERSAYDGFAMVSDWQRNEFVRAFELDRERTFILRNAIAPSFASMFADGQSVLAQKRNPPVLTYTSTPFRGLDLLLDAWPSIRAAAPGARLQVFSSMRVYQNSPEQDESAYGALYKLCRELDGVEYFGSISQPELSVKLRATTMLAYPNTFPETSCIAVMEAMASGCRIVTSDLGALPETTGGFGNLVSIRTNDREASTLRFADEAIRVLEQQRSDPIEAERFLRRQISHVNAHCTWGARANEWANWLGEMCGALEPQPGRGVSFAQRIARLFGGAPNTGDR